MSGPDASENSVLIGGKKWMVPRVTGYRWLLCSMRFQNTYEGLE